MLGFAATLSPSAYWYLARGTGAVALVLLTASVVLGIVGTVVGGFPFAIALALGRRSRLPVIQALSSDSRNTAGAAMSSG